MHGLQRLAVRHFRSASAVVLSKLSAVTYTETGHGRTHPIMAESNDYHSVVFGEDSLVDVPT